MTRQGRRFITAADADRKCNGVVQRARYNGLQLRQFTCLIESDVFVSPEYRYAQGGAASTVLNDFESSPEWRAGRRVKEGGRLGGLEKAKSSAGVRSACRARAKEIWARRPTLSTRAVARVLISTGNISCKLSTVRGYIADLNPRKQSC